MKYFKYIICIIFGILIFLLWNTANTFSIGNQYKLDLTGSAPTDPNRVLKTMFDTIVSRQKICIENEFEQCYLTMNAGGGSCQINTLINLYQTALGVGFSHEDHDYINSQGLNLKDIPNIKTTYDYLTNRETMKPLLRHNGINSNVNIITDFALNITNFKLDHLYPVYIGFRGMNPPVFFKQDGTTQYSFGHNLLMYKTNYAGLSSFITYLDSESTDPSSHLYVDLLEIKTQLDSLNPNIRNNSIVCIMIDKCNHFFYTVTEFSNPSTLHLFDDDGNPLEQEVLRYNDLWRVKLISTFIKSLRLYSVIKFTNASNGELIERNVSDLTPDDLNLSPTSNPTLFIDSVLFNSYLYEDKVYGEDEVPVIKDRDDFLGFPNILCRESGEPLCRDPDYYCHENLSVNNASYSICKQLGELDTPARMNIPHCDNNLYRETQDDVNYFCKSKGALDTPCMDDPPGNCNPNLNCNSDNICKLIGGLDGNCNDGTCNDDLQCINDTCRNDLLQYDNNPIFKSDNSTFDASYNYNDNWIDGEIIAYHNITDFTNPIYLGKYKKTTIRKILNSNKDINLYIQYDGNDLVLIYGDLVRDNLFIEKGRKTINRDFLWHPGKPNDLGNQNFITINFNDDTYTYLSSATGENADSIVQLSNILRYLNFLRPGAACAAGIADGREACGRPGAAGDTRCSW